MSSDLMKEDLIKGLLDIFSGDIEAIMLYDSVARNESTSESDIDIAVIIKREMDDEKTGTFYRLGSRDGKGIRKRGERKCRFFHKR